MKLFSIMIIGCVACLSMAATSFAQFAIPWDGGGGNSNWTTAANWDHPSGGLPTGAFDETAVIDNGDTVEVSSNLANIPLPDGPPGGLAVSSGSTLQVMGSGAFLTDDSGPTVNGSALFTSGGTLSIVGSAASFKSSSLSFAGGGIYNPVLTSASHGLMSVSGSLAVDGGTLKPSFGFSPTPQSWVLADAGSITGNFAVDTSALGLGPGNVIRTSVVPGGVNGQQLLLNYEKVLVLTANVDTGAVSMSSPSGTPIAITAYSLTSGSGKLNPASWTSLHSQLGGGWGIAGTPNTSRLEELAGPKTPTQQDSLTLNSTPRSLGSAYNANLPFQTTPTDSLSFQYVTTAGQLAQGVVEFTGLNTVNNLLLTVDLASGNAQLRNSSTTTIKLRGYTISSAAGSLKPANGDWNSLKDHGIAGVDEANGTANFLSELVPSVSNPLVLAPGASYMMGDLFNTTKAEDLQLEFVMAGGPLEGDFNSDGAVNAADYTVWRDHLGSLYTAADYLKWKSNFGATDGGNGSVITNGVVQYGAISSGAASVSAVPEPHSCWFAILAVLGLAANQRR